MTSQHIGLAIGKVIAATRRRISLECVRLVIIMVCVLNPAFVMQRIVMQSPFGSVALQFKEQPRRILNDFFDGSQEADRFASIDDAMIVRQRDVHHRTNHHITIDAPRDVS